MDFTSPRTRHREQAFLPSVLLLLLIFLSKLLLAEPAASGVVEATAAFDFTSFSLRNLTLLGDSYLRDGAVGLTKETGVPATSCGTVARSIPVRLRDPASNTTASFSSTFSFSITNRNPDSFGDGLAFFLSTKNLTLGSPGAYLGLFNASGDSSSSPAFAVEFDTRMDEGFQDPGSNHVGLDIGGPESVVVEDLLPAGIDLKSGNLITVWIDYSAGDGTLSVWLSYANVKPQAPALSAKYDLSLLLSEYMYAGFSASTEGSTEVHTVFGWSFRSFGLPPPLAPKVNMSSSLIPWNDKPSGERAGVAIAPAVPVPDSGISNESESGKKNKKRILLGLAFAAIPILFCGSVALVACAVIRVRPEYASFFCRRGSGKTRGSSGKIGSFGKTGSIKKLQIETEVVRGPRKFTYKELSIATQNFNRSRIVGTGSFGAVYKATHPAWPMPYAVKRSKHPYEQTKAEFLGELSIIAGLRHKNLVQLQGWCDEKGELLLVYEFMPNGTLDRALYGNDAGRQLPLFTWEQRQNAAVGLASVLNYLHSGCEQRVVHRDIKTSNVMLDVGLKPRLGDFGLARLTEHGVTSPCSTLTAGTMGYLAPEYVQYGKATEKTDVFSYGVVILEMCCGRRPIEKEKPSLVDWVWALHAKDRLLECADPKLAGEFNEEGMRRLLLVGLSCTNPDYSDRPTMGRVLQWLGNDGCEEPGIGRMPRVPRIRPCLTFSCSLPLSINDVVDDEEEEERTGERPCPLYEVKIL